MKKLMLILLSGITLLSFTACGKGESQRETSKVKEAVSSESAGISFVDDNGVEITLPAQPKNIISTSVVITGTLLALDAPIKASGGSMPNSIGLDENGWFTQWSDIAKERGLKSLFVKQELNLEAIIAAKPDLIFVSKSGGDSHFDHYEQLKKIAPTVVIDYNSNDWRTVTEKVANIIGLSENANKILKDFDESLKKIKEEITPPNNPVNIAVYSGSGGLSVGLPTAPQALILTDLGFVIQDTGIKAEEGRTDFAFTTVEQALQSLKQDTLLLVGNSAEEKDSLLVDSQFSSLPAVQKKKVYELGVASFKLDYYAALDLVKHVKMNFAK